MFKPENLLRLPPPPLTRQHVLRSFIASLVGPVEGERQYGNGRNTQFSGRSWRMGAIQVFLKAFVLLILALFLILGCDKSTGPSTKGTIRIYMTDAPTSFEAVVIVVQSVEIHKAGYDDASGWVTVDSRTRSFDLLRLRNGASAVLGEATLDAGHYTQVRLLLGDGNYVTISGVNAQLTVPSSIQTGIKLNHQFEIQADALYELTLDFDASKSITVSGTGTFVLSPVIRIEANETSGTISGTVVPVAARAAVSTTVGSDTVKAFADTTNGYFKLTALPGGASYTLKIAPSTTAYRDTTIAGVAVKAQQNTDIGTVTLSIR